MLYESLAAYLNGGPYPMHMPGHKRNPAFALPNPYSIDVTEVEGTDNLHHPLGIIRDFMEHLKGLYRTEETFLLVGGSTCGILSAVSACCRKGDTVLLDRNCHRSVYHAVCLLGLRPVYLLPDTDAASGISAGVSPEEVAEKMNQVLCAAPGGKPGAVIITSPTYEGVVPDIGAIAELVHQQGIPLIVDEAHGAHLPWADAVVQGMPSSALRYGADVVIQSLHKTLPALTQTALLHLGTKRVSGEEIARWLDVYETSSPSYVLMASIGQCMNFLESQGEEAFREYGKRLVKFYEEAEKWRLFSLWQCPDKDPSKLIIRTGRTGFTGPQLGKMLRDSYHIEVEMEASSYILGISSVADSEESLVHFADAILDIERNIPGKAEADKRCGFVRPEEPEICMGIYEAMTGAYTSLPYEKSLGRISSEYAMIYPPGAPFLVPGERITEAVLRRFREAEKDSLALTGPAGWKGKNIRVIKE